MIAANLVFGGISALIAARVHKLFTESDVDISKSNDIILNIPILNYLKLEEYHV